MTGPPLAALLTPPGRGAIATIGVSVQWATWPALDALPFHAANSHSLRAQVIGRIVFGRWGTDSVEDVVVCLVTDNSIEIHCHGGEAAVRRILRDLEVAGCHVVPWSELLRQSQSPLRAEILADVCRATTLRTAAFLWEQANGAFETAVGAFIASASADLGATVARIRDCLSQEEFGLHLTRPWSVALVGRPNVGKSSLINAILGYTRSIVFDQPGTTRDIVSATTAIDGWPVELLDMAGLRESSDPLEAAGIARARATLAAADRVILLIDLSEPPSQADRELLAEHPREVVVAHKCDLPPYDGPDCWLPNESRSWLPVSSKTGAGIDALLSAIAGRLVPHAPPYDAPIPTTERQIALLQRALRAAENADLSATLEALCQLRAGADGQPAEPHSANRKGSPATS